MLAPISPTDYHVGDDDDHGMVMVMVMVMVMIMVMVMVMVIMVMVNMVKMVMTTCNPCQGRVKEQMVVSGTEASNVIKESPGQ